MMKEIVYFSNVRKLAADALKGYLITYKVPLDSTQKLADKRLKKLQKDAIKLAGPQYRTKVFEFVRNDGKTPAHLAVFFKASVILRLLDLTVLTLSLQKRTVKLV